MPLKIERWRKERNLEIVRKFKKLRKSPRHKRAIPILVKDTGLTGPTIRHILKEMGAWDR